MAKHQISLSKFPMRRSIARFATLCQRVRAYGRDRLLELIGIRRLARPIDPLSDLATGLEAYAQKPIDDDEPNDDEPLPIEEGLNRSEPGEA